MKKMQYSKKIATAVTAGWFVFRIVAFILGSCIFECTDFYVQLMEPVDTVMMVNLGFYAGNSVAEKAILRGMSFRRDDDEEEEEEGNG